MADTGTPVAPLQLKYQFWGPCLVCKTSNDFPWLSNCLWIRTAHFISIYLMFTISHRYVFLSSCKYNLTSGGQGTCLIYFLCILLSLQHSAGHQVGDSLIYILHIKSKAKHPSTLLSHHEEISQCLLPSECHVLVERFLTELVFAF